MLTLVGSNEDWASYFTCWNHDVFMGTAIRTENMGLYGPLSAYTSRYWDTVSPSMANFWLWDHYVTPSTLDYMISENFLEVEKPRPIKYDLNVDFGLYGNQISLLDAFLDNGLKLPTPETHHEYGVKHVSVHGTTYAGITRDTQIASSDASVFGKTYPTTHFKAFKRIAALNGLPSGGVDTGPGLLGLRDLLPYMDDWSNASIGVSKTYLGTYPSNNYTTLLSCDVVSGPGSKILTYSHLVRRGTGPSSWAQTVVTTTMTITASPSFYTTGDGRSISGAHCTITDVYSSYQRYFSWQSASFGYGGPTVTFSGPVRAYERLSGTANGVGEVTPSYRSIFFTDVIHEGKRLEYIEMPQLYGTAYDTMALAMEEVRGKISSNYIETIAELDQVFSLLPKESLGKLTKLLNTRIASLSDDVVRGLYGNTKRKKRLSAATVASEIISGALTLADVLASAQLALAFGILPLLQDMQNLAGAFDALCAKLIVGPHTGYGMKTFAFTSEGLQKYTLTTRTELRVELPSQSVIAGLLRLDKAGLAPTPSALWDLLPFSFVADWFIDIGGKINLMENYTYALLSRILYCVHSYTLTRDLDGLLMATGTRTASGSYFQYYERRASIFPVAPKHYPSTILANANVPELSGSALLWTVIRS